MASFRSHSLSPSPSPSRGYKLRSFAHMVGVELGIHSLYHSPLDTKILCLSRCVRLFAYGASTIILALFLSSLGVSDARIGAFMTLTLLGDVFISFFLTLFADAVGRRRMLMLGAAMMVASGVVFGLSGNYWLLVVASVVGVISPSGNEIGPFKAIEESTISQLIPSNIRSDILAWYILFGTIGTAIGTGACGWVVEDLQRNRGWTDTGSYRIIFFGYAAVGAVELLLALLLSKNTEPPRKHHAIEEPETTTIDETRPLLSAGLDNPPETNGHISDYNPITPKPKRSSIFALSLLPSISPESRTLLLKLSLLFSLDSISSGLCPASLIAYFLARKFDLPEGVLGTIFFTTSLIASCSNLIASSLSRRIGLIRTMVFTHVPASIALALIPLPSKLWLALLFLIIRASTNSMDQAPRQAFLAAAVLPGERTAVMGTVNVVKTLSQSVGPVVTGILAQKGLFWVAFVVAGALKLVYDVGLLVVFAGWVEREEDGDGPSEEEDEEGHRRTLTSEGELLSSETQSGS